MFFEVAEGRPHAAHVGAFEQFFLCIVVEGFRIFVQVKAGEPLSPLYVAAVSRIGHAQQIEKEVALSLVHPVVALLVLLDHHGMAVTTVVAGELPRDSIESLVGVLQQFIVAAEQVQQGPVVEALIAGR